MLSGAQVTRLAIYGGIFVQYGSFAGKTEQEPPVVVEETQNPGGWPSYGLRRKRKPRVEEIEEEIEAVEVEIEDHQKTLDAERQERGRLEAKSRRKKAEQQALERLRTEIAAELAAIEDMRRVHDELLTLRALEEIEDRKRRKRNLIIALTLDD